MDASPSSPSLGNIPENYSVPPRVASEEKGRSNKVLGGRTGRDEYDAYVSKGQTKSDQERKASV